MYKIIDDANVVNGSVMDINNFQKNMTLSLLNGDTRDSQ